MKKKFGSVGRLNKDKTKEKGNISLGRLSKRPRRIKVIFVLVLDVIVIVLVLVVFLLVRFPV